MNLYSPDCKNLLRTFSNLQVEHVYREANQCTDALARIGSTSFDAYILFINPRRISYIPLIKRECLVPDLFLSNSSIPYLPPKKKKKFIIFKGVNLLHSWSNLFLRLQLVYLLVPQIHKGVGYLFRSVSVCMVIGLWARDLGWSSRLTSHHHRSLLLSWVFSSQSFKSQAREIQS